MAKDGFEHEYGWARGRSERLQSYGKNVGRPGILLAEYDRDEVLGMGPYRPSNGVEGRGREAGPREEDVSSRCLEDGR